MIDFAFCGTGGNLPLPTRFLSSILLSYKGRKILFDAGEGLQVAMRKLKWGFRTVDIICLSHMHGDHILGLPGLLATIGNSDRKEPIQIVAPPSSKRVLQGLLTAVPALPFSVELLEADEGKYPIYFKNDQLTLVTTEDMPFSSLFSPNRKANVVSQNKLDFQKSLQYEGFEILNNEGFPECTLSISKLYHSLVCNAYRLDFERQGKFLKEKAEALEIPRPLWKCLQKGMCLKTKNVLIEPQAVMGEQRKGISFVFATDTRPVPTLIPFAQSASVFICEGTYGDSQDQTKAKKNRHCCFFESATLAKNANVEHLILTHFSPSMPDPTLFRDEATNIFEKTTLAKDGMSFRLKYSDDGSDSLELLNECFDNSNDFLDF